MNKEELKEGMYVRTNDSRIGKFIEKTETYNYRGFSMIEENKYFAGYRYYFDGIMDNDDNTALADWEIEEIEMKPSFDIIDLIKPGDYVNGYKVYKIDIIAGQKYIVITINEAVWLTPNQIETIVTKEAFESVMYEVKNENI